MHGEENPSLATPIPLKEGERLDALGKDGRLRIIQNADLFQFTTDAYLLASFARPSASDLVLELGSGSGVVLLLLAARTGITGITGLEIQERLVEVAERNILLNQLSERAKILLHDFRQDSPLLSARFDLVISNPPYLRAGEGSPSMDMPITMAKQELNCVFKDIARAAKRWLRARGRFVLVHRPIRLPEIMAELEKVSLTPKKLVLVHPKPDAPAGLFLLEARGGAHPGLSIDPPLIVRGRDGGYTMEIEKVFAGEWPWKP